jgi:hypothetical protein
MASLGLRPRLLSDAHLPKTAGPAPTFAGFRFQRLPPAGWFADRSGCARDVAAVGGGFGGVRSLAHCSRVQRGVQPPNKALKLTPKSLSATNLWYRFGSGRCCASADGQRFLVQLSAQPLGGCGASSFLLLASPPGLQSEERVFSAVSQAIGTGLVHVPLRAAVQHDVASVQATASLGGAPSRSSWRRSYRCGVFVPADSARGLVRSSFRVRSGCGGGWRRPCGCPSPCRLFTGPARGAAA